MAWFQRTKTQPPILPTTKTDYPEGTCVETEAGWFFIKKNYRFRIPTRRVLDSWRFNVVQTTEAAVKHYKVAGKLGFRDGTIIDDFSDGRMYIIAGNKRRHIVNPDFFERTGIDHHWAITVSSEEANLHDDGEVLS